MDDNTLPPTDDGQLRALAASLGCATEAEVSVLARVKLTTLRAWRKRNQGPPHIMFGNNVLYTHDALRQYLIRRQHERPTINAKALL